MKNKKYAFNFYQIFENDALRDYLEHMALNGWRLTKIGSIFLHFEACVPHPIRYCVEVMEKPSAYASNQTLPLKRYREFCRDAGWDYIGTNGFLHIFCTEDMEAVPVETDVRERYARICGASRGITRTTVILFSAISLINLSVCWQKKTLLCTQGFLVLLLLSAGLYMTGDFLLWKNRAKRSLAESGILPHYMWASTSRKNNLGVAAILILCICFLLFSCSNAPSAALPYILAYLFIYLISMSVFSALLYWLREKNDFAREINILIYWGAALLLVVLITAVLFLFL